MLFKYVSNPNHVLEEGYIRATQLSALNDPFEANYSQEGLKKLNRECESTMDDGELIDHIEENKHKIGVISFSESKDDLLMWAHYANEHKGALIGFWNEPTSISNVFLANRGSLFEKYNCFIGECLPVKYRKQPLYEIDPFDRDYSNVSAEGADRILFEIFQQKSDEWIYEKEHRITLKLEQADRVIIKNYEQYKNEKWFKNIFIKNNPKEKYFFRFDNNELFILLENITDDGDRQVYGNIIATLAKDNPNILYLFSLGNLGISIWSIAYGLKVDKKSIKSYANGSMITRFEELEVFKSQGYALTFKEIKR